VFGQLGKIFQVVEAAAADNPDRWLVHPRFELKRKQNEKAKPIFPVIPNESASPARTSMSKFRATQPPHSQHRCEPHWRMTERPIDLDYTRDDSSLSSCCSCLSPARKHHSPGGRRDRLDERQHNMQRKPHSDRRFWDR
jgi:hypothetical protein